MRALLFSGVAIFPLIAHAQSVPVLTPRVTLDGPNGMRAAFATKLDASGGVASNLTVNGGALNGLSSIASQNATVSGALSAQTATIAGAFNGATGSFSSSLAAAGAITTGAYFSGIYHLVPDTLKIASDGTDDAPSINRAATQCRNQLAIRCEIDLLPRVYQINSGVNLAEAQIILHGMDIQERMPALTGGVPVTPWAGTWLQVSSTGFAPVTLGGYGGGGTVIENLGIYEVQPTPPTNGSWTPTAYGPFFSSQNGGLSLTYRNIFMLGITQGIYSDGDQRLTVDGIKGQAFQYAVSAHHDYDTATVKNIHMWPFWSDATPVVAYQQANLDAVILGRVDGGFLDNIFSFGTRSAIRLAADGDENSSEPGGPPTKIWIGALSCDFTYACIWGDSTVGSFDISVGYMNTQGQAYGVSPAAPIPGASAFILNGYGSLNIHELYTQFADNAVGQVLSATGTSHVSIGAIRVDPTPMRANGFLFGGSTPSSGANQITLATRPLIVGVEPSGFTVFQTGSGLNVVWPQIATVAAGTAP